MYFSARLAIDPSQLTKIETVVPTKTFKKFLAVLTGGATTKRVEKETFNALGILQQFSSVFHALKIDNVVRMSQDEIDIYLDRNGAESDLSEALSKYDIDSNEDMSEQFQTLHLVLEHLDDHFKYWIKIKICKTHEVGEYPIAVEINALFKEFLGLSRSEIEAQLSALFEGQKSYDKFVENKESEFHDFLDKLSENVKEYIHIDDIIQRQRKKIIIPHEHLEVCDQVQIQNYGSDPVFHSYFGTNECVFYTFIWTEMLIDHDIVVSDLLLFSEEGEPVGEIGLNDRVKASRHPVINYKGEYEVIMREAAQDYKEIVSRRKPEKHEAGGNKGWFDFINEEAHEEDWY